MANQSSFRILRELNSIQKNADLSIVVAHQEKDLSRVKAIIIGPSETPYEFGFFEFNIDFPSEYPERPPSVQATTTNGGRCRFNPNIYADGKVCLSILGTWRGERGEQWSSAQGLESVLISIQSLMSPNPYENEPGFEKANSPSDQKYMANYIEKIRHETLRISIIQRLEQYLGIFSDGTVAPPKAFDSGEGEYDLDDEEEILATFEPFKDLCKQRFLWYYDSYMNSIREGEKAHKQGTSFTTMPFESSRNAMEGQFDYSKLKKRLEAIHHTIALETARWGEEGLNFVKREHITADHMAEDYRKVVEHYKKHSDAVTIDIEMENKNPFVWIITYFGRPMTHLDGGMFRIRMSISPRFPEEQPRVRFETPLYHHRIGRDGVLCYIPKKPSELLNHMEAIIDAIEAENPPYDPRTLVNPEASRLFWGTDDEKKQYNRLLRRSVQRSMEE